MSSSVGGARHDGSRGSWSWWQTSHERAHERRDHELDRRYHALEGKVDHGSRELELRVRKLERAVYTLTAVAATTTITALVNLALNVVQQVGAQ